MKKLIMSLFVVIGAMSLIACSKDSRINDINKEENVYAISVVTGVDAVINNGISLNSLLSTSKVMESQFPPINKANINTMLSVLNNEAFDVLVLESDKSEFESLIKVTINNDRIFNYYFNEVLASESTETNKDETEIEREFLINGLIIENNLEYLVTGTKEIESEKDNKESEEELTLELTITSKLDEKNYTTIKYETDLETENKDGKTSTESKKTYKYKVYVDNELTKEMKMSFELEDNELELKLDVSENNIEYIYKLKINDKAKKAIIEYLIKEKDEQDIKGSLTINIKVDSDGKIVYTYQDQ